MSYGEDDAVRSQTREIPTWITWPGKADKEPEPERAVPLSADLARWERGRKQFAVSCAVCHSLSGLGEEGKRPPLVDSEWTLGSEQRLVRIILNGLHGPIKVGGKVYGSVEIPRS